MTIPPFFSVKRGVQVKCSNCGFRFNAGKTCPSCGHNDSEIGSPERAHASRIKCGKCGFRYDFGEYCPSCGNSNPVRDPEILAQNYAKNYVDRTKPKSWVLVVSIIGIVYNVFFSFVYSFLAYREFKYNPQSSLIYIVLFVLSVASILLFINLLRMKKWAVWGLRILGTISTILLASTEHILNVPLFYGWLWSETGNYLADFILSLPFYAALAWTAAFWFADWFD